MRVLFVLLCIVFAAGRVEAEEMKCFEYNASEMAGWKVTKRYKKKRYRRRRRHHRSRYYTVTRSVSRKIPAKIDEVYISLEKGRIIEDEPIDVVVRSGNVTYRQNAVYCTPAENGSFSCGVLDSRKRFTISKEMSITNIDLDFFTNDHYEIPKSVFSLKSSSTHKEHRARAILCPMPAEHYVCFAGKKRGKYTGCTVSRFSCYSSRMLLYGFYAADIETKSAVERCKRYKE